MPDCRASGCQYSKNRSGMRAVSSCKCDACPVCGANIRPTSPQWHQQWCKMRAWIPPHHRGKMTVHSAPVLQGHIKIQLSKPILFIPIQTLIVDAKSSSD